MDSQTRIVYACSGCADVGEIADQVSRKLRRDGYASPKASCIVGIGAGLKPFIEAAKSATTVITIDGCEVACAQKLIENIDLKPRSVILTHIGLEKGRTTISSELVENLSHKIMKSID